LIRIQMVDANLAGSVANSKKKHLYRRSDSSVHQL
jgi:hypothetical protein